MVSHVAGYVLVILSALCFGTSSILIKLGYAMGLTPIQFLIGQNLCCVVMVWPILLAIKRELAKVTPRTLLRLGIQGLGGNLATSLLVFFALERLPAGLAVLLLFTYPVVVCLGNWLFFGKTPSAGETAALTLAVIGILLAVNVYSDDFMTTVDPVGVMLAVGGAVAYAFYTLYGEKLLADTHPLVVTVYPLTVSTLTLALIFPPHVLWAGAVTAVRAELIIVSAVIGILLPVYFSLQGLRMIGASHTAIASTAELPLTLVMAYLVLGEKMTVTQLLGGGLILAAIMILRRGQAACTERD